MSFLERNIRMAELKEKVKVEVGELTLIVWATNVVQFMSEIETIKGIHSVICYSKNRLFAYPDPRYDIKEIAEEIEQLLLAEVPDIFREIQ